MCQPGEDIPSAQAALLEQAVSFLGNRPPQEIAEFRRRVSNVLAAADHDEIRNVLERIRTTGREWGYHPPDAFARRVHYAMADVVLTPDSCLEGGDVLDTAGSGSLVFLPNHLSYSDANLFEILLHRAGHDRIADRLSVIAGPKVYSELFRRFSSLCFGTIKTPQSSSRSTGEAVMPPREVARLARASIQAAADRRAAGDHLLVFVEGTRSRTGGMQPTLAAISRYFEDGSPRLVPVGITGSDKLVPVEDERMHPTRVVVRIGRPVDSEQLRRRCGGNRRLMMDVIGLLIARLLPHEHRGVYSDETEGLAPARAIAADLASL